MDSSTLEAVWNFSTEPLLCSLEEVYGYYLITKEFIFLRETLGEKTH